MNKLEQAARQALEALECWDKAGYVPFIFARERAIIALREALAEQAEQERKYGELAGTHNWTPPNYTDEQWQKLDQEYQDHVAEQALQKLSDFHQSIERNGHWSDCSTHNEPAYPNGECDCGGYPAKQEPVDGVLPCPFCGDNKPTVFEGSTFRWRVAVCNNCGAYAPEVRHDTLAEDQKHAGIKSDDAAITAWNTRAAPVSTKDLTDDEIDAIEIITDRQFARAVIQEFRRKNGIV